MPRSSEALRRTSPGAFALVRDRTRAVTEAALWIVVPTFNERENLATLARSVLAEVPQAHLLIVDDNSPDGTGRLADELARENARISVLHRMQKQGLGPAYRQGMRYALSSGAEILVQMDCDFSHDPAAIPSLIYALQEAELVLGSRYVSGGRTANWSVFRKVISRGGCLVAQVVLWLPYRDLTGGFKAWRADLLERIAFEEVRASGYGFQIEMTWRAHRAGARILEVPILFREREAGTSKMSGRIVSEALLLLLRLRLRALGSLRSGK